MDMKRQEVARVQMEHSVWGAAQDVEHAMEEAKSFTAYDVRLAAWDRALRKAQVGRDTMAAYMRNYGLLGEA